MQRETARRDRMVGLFIGGVVLFNPPILNLVAGTIHGWPSLYIYLFAVWGGLIACVALVNRGAGRANKESDGDVEGK